MYASTAFQKIRNGLKIIILDEVKIENMTPANRKIHKFPTKIQTFGEKFVLDAQISSNFRTQARSSSRSMRRFIGATSPAHDRGEDLVHNYVQLQACVLNN